MIGDLDAVTVAAFLSYLDHEQGNSTATRNARLAAIHSFYRYALPLIPDRAHTASQVLAIPQRRHDRAIVSYLTSLETDALLAAPDRTTWYGRRDHALLLTTVQTGLRVSEVTGLTIQDITTTTPGADVHTTGKGRKKRATPLTRQTAAVLRAWLPEAGPAPSGPAFPTHRGTRMSADAVQRLVAKHATTAALSCPSINSKRVTPHTRRHTAAMTLLHAGVDTSVIALWLGHQSPVTTHIYLYTDMTIKERALARIPNRTPPLAATGPLTTSSTSSKGYETELIPPGLCRAGRPHQAHRTARTPLSATTTST
jgi:site-specific recombinase XerD